MSKGATNPARVVVIGAGSNSFAGNLILAFAEQQATAPFPLEILLVDVDAPRLSRVHAFAEAVLGQSQATLPITSTTDLAAALAGARYVVSAVARDRYRLWEQDYRVPASFGVRHVLGENGGPGSLFHYFRSMGLLGPIADTLRRIAPDALWLNYTNPLGRVVHGAASLHGAEMVGLCHGALEVRPVVAGYLGCAERDLEITTAGINHLYAVLSAVDTRTGVERLPEVVARARDDRAAPPLFRSIAEIFGVISFPSDDHLGEYFGFGASFQDGRWPYGAESGWIPTRNASSRLIDDVLGRPAEAATLRTTVSDLAVDIITSVERDEPRDLAGINVINSAPYVEGLPLSAAVEVPAAVDGNGIRAKAVGRLPEPFAAFIRQQIEITEAATTALRTRRRVDVLRALLLDPTVTSVESAERIMATMLQLQREYIPAFD